MSPVSTIPCGRLLAAALLSATCLGSAAAGARAPEAPAPIEADDPGPEVLPLPGTAGAPGDDPASALLEQLGFSGRSVELPSAGEWIVVPIPFRSPLLGFGLKLGIARLAPAESAGGEARVNVTGLGGMYAEGGSWATVAGDRRYWAGGRLRTTLAAAAGEFNYDLRLGDEYDFLRIPVRQEVRGAVLDASWRVSRHVWLGGGMRYGRSPVSLRGLPPAIQQQLPNVTFDLLGLQLKGEWDSRSDEFYPLDGTYATGTVNYTMSDSVAPDTSYFRYKLAYNNYRSIDERNVLAWRAAFDTVSGDAPFFGLPWFGSGVDLRGYTPGRYIGKSLIAVQAEWRWQATRRLGLVGFAGVGKVYGEVPVFDQSDWLPAGGVGLRWRLTDENRLNFRIDYGRGRDDETLIISVGEAF